MSEKSAITDTPTPRTRQSLTNDLQALGVIPGMTIIVHTSLKAIGWVCGGPVALIQALMDTLTPTGTLIMPTHSSNYSDPAIWQNPPVPEAWHDPIRQTMPPFDPAITPTYAIGRVPELFRTWPGVLRSHHPQLSFAAWGQHAAQITQDHPLAYALGEGSPLARIYELEGYVLLLGVGYDRNTSFHLAEYRAPGSGKCRSGAPILRDGQRVWQTYDDIDYDEEPFPQIGAALEEAHSVRIGLVGSAKSRLFSQKTAVDFAEQWLVNTPFSKEK